MDPNTVFNVKETPQAFLANTRDRLAAPINPTSSNHGGRTQDRLPTPMRPSLTSRPVVTSASPTSNGWK